MDTKAWTASNLAARLLAGPRTLDDITAAIDAVLGPMRARTRAKLATAILALAEDTHPPSPRSLASLLLASPDFHPPSLGRHAAAYGETPCSAPSYAGSRGGPRMTAPNLDDKTRTELEAAAFRRLVEHLRERTDVQNILCARKGSHPHESIRAELRTAAAIREPGAAAAIIAAVPRNFRRFIRFDFPRMSFRRSQCLIPVPLAMRRIRRAAPVPRMSASLAQ